MAGKHLPIHQIKTQQNAFRHFAFKLDLKVSLTQPLAIYVSAELLRPMPLQDCETQNSTAMEPSLQSLDLQQFQERQDAQVPVRSMKLSGLRDRGINYSSLARNKKHTRLDLGI